MKKLGRNFKLVLASQTISLLGGNILNFALSLFILDFTQSVGAFASIMAISQIPVVLLSLVGGIIADRMDKKKLIVVFDAIKAIICIVLLVIFLTDTYSVVNLALAMVLFMSIVTLFTPILSSATPSIVEEDALVEANGAMGMIQSMSDLLAVLVGGVLFATIGIRNIIVLAGVAFLVSTVLDLFINIPHIKKEAEFGAVKTTALDVKDSFSFTIKKAPFVLKISFLFALIALLFTPIMAIALPFIMRVQFGASDTMFGISQALPGIGMLLGGMLSGVFKKWLDVKHFSKLILIIASLTTVLAVSVYIPSFGGATILPFWLFSIAMMFIMVVFVFLNITVMSRIQTEVPKEYLGKIIAVFMTIISFATPIGQYVFGQSMALFIGNISMLFVAIAILTIGVAVVAKKVFNPKKAKGQNIQLTPATSK